MKKFLLVSFVLAMMIVMVSGITMAAVAPEVPAVQAAFSFPDRLGVVWKPVDGAVSYDVYVSNKNDVNTAKKVGTRLATDKVSNIANSVNTQYMVPFLQPASTYYIWVKAINESGSSDFSKVYVGYTSSESVNPVN